MRQLWQGAILLLLTVAGSGMPMRGYAQASAFPQIWSVCSSGCDFPDIQTAVDHVNSNDTIVIEGSSTAYAGFGDPSKNLTINGSGSVTISGGGPVVTVGGAASQPTVTIRNVTVTRANNTNTVGGGILNYGALTLSDSTVSDNYVGLHDGGGIYNTAGAGITLTADTISGNTAAGSNGGGIYNATGGTVTLTGSTVSHNAAGGTSLGGGIYNGGTMTVIGSTISGSETDYGGGIANGGILYVTNSTIQGNYGYTSGGGVYNFGSLTAANSTISGNRIYSGAGGGIYVNSGSANLGNTILAGNTSTGPGSDPDCWGSLTDTPGHNLLGIRSSNCSGLSTTHGDLIGSVAGPLDPKLEGLLDNGGPTVTMALLPGSPAIGAGDTTTCRSTGAGGVNDQDQRGAPRNTAGRGTCDIGAYDTGRPAVTWYVGLAGSDSIDCSANSSGSPFHSIPYALSCAFRGDTISLAATGTGAFAGQFTIGKTITLAGPSGGTATISGSAPNGGTVVVTVGQSGAATEPTVTFQRLTISGGNNTSSLSGGGILNYAALTLTNSTITGNIVYDYTNFKYTNGGGIDNAGSLKVDNSVISNNSSSGGGGGIYNSGTLVVTNDTISGNGAFYGGGIGNIGSLTVINSTISGNSGNQGAGLNTAQIGTATITGSTISDNKATAVGGGVLNSGLLTVTNTSIRGNMASTAGGGVGSASGARATTIIHTTISGNTVSGATGHGGGISNTEGDLAVSDSTISGNSVPGASALGGGIYTGGSSQGFNVIMATVINSTISGNSAPNYVGGGIYVNSDPFGQNTAILENTILAQNTAAIGPDCDGILSDGSVGHNLLGTNDHCTDLSNGSNGNLVGTAAGPLHARLSTLAPNGGPTQTMALLTGSPAINAGNATTCAISPVDDLDQRGEPRLSVSRTTCDMGAYDTATPVVPIARGWNLLDLPVGGIDSTAQLASMLDSAPGGSSISAVATYANGRFSVYVPGYAATQGLQPSQGIFVLSKGAGTWIPAGTRYTVGRPVSLHPGWNLVAAPFPAGGLTAGTIANEIDAHCSSGPCSVKAIATYSGGSYTTYLPGSGGTNVPVFARSGMWIEMGAAASWTPH